MGPNRVLITPAHNTTSYYDIKITVSEKSRKKVAPIKALGGQIREYATQAPPISCQKGCG